MDGSTIQQFVQLIITLVVVIVGGVWVVASIRTTTSVLASKIGDLSKAIDKMQVAIHAMSDDHNNLSERVTRLEVRVDQFDHHHQQQHHHHQQQQQQH